MNPISAFIVAYRAIQSNKIRSVLTTLGIIIGVATVIALVALTSGAKQMIEEQLTGLGSKSLNIKSGKRGIGARDNAPILTIGDAEAVAELDVIERITPLLNKSELAVADNKNWYTIVLGTSPDFVYINDWFPERGSFYNEADVVSAKKVCVLGKTVASKLFGYQDPIGQNVRIGSSSFKVIGIMSPLGQTSSGKDQDDIVLVPYKTFQKRIEGVTKVNTIAASVNDPGNIALAEAQIIELLLERHNVDRDKDNPFYVRTQTTVIERIITISSIMTILLGSIASISLVVGGIGIMNIMLVSVGERTREIGIRIAVGAKEKDILTQFLIEAVLISLVGGLIGIFIGIAGSQLASYFTGWPSVISINMVFISFGFAAFIGVFFGIYPARKASKLDPIEALRYE
jgi:putative ABC transport system permease protein